jgi:hypothetical protein
MGWSTTLPRLVALLAIFTLGLSLGVPAQDDPDTLYDESETLSYEIVSSFSIVLPLVAARATQGALSSLHPESGAPLPVSAASLRDTDANRSANTRTPLAIFCTLRC